MCCCHPIDDGRLAIRAFEVLREDDSHTFNYAATAGTDQALPLPLLPMVGEGQVAQQGFRAHRRRSAVNTAVPSDPAYSGFTFEDRNGTTWIHRACGEPELYRYTSGRASICRHG